MIELSGTTATLEARFAGLPADAVREFADVLMQALDAHAAVVGPMVVVDTTNGQLTVSFEFVGVGDPSVDVPRGMHFITEATPAAREAGRALAGATVVGLAMGWASTAADAPQLALV